jgi:hypothetical protein
MEHIVHMEKVRYVHKTLYRKPKLKEMLGRSRHRWVDSIKIYIKGTGYEAVDLT